MAAAASCFCGKTLELERSAGIALAEVKQVQPTAEGSSNFRGCPHENTRTMFEPKLLLWINLK
jgi:organic hydroperoxide reductase OsmC/OhrA